MFSVTALHTQEIMSVPVPARDQCHSAQYFFKSCLVSCSVRDVRQHWLWCCAGACTEITPFGIAVGKCGLGAAELMHKIILGWYVEAPAHAKSLFKLKAYYTGML